MKRGQLLSRCCSTLCHDNDNWLRIDGGGVGAGCNDAVDGRCWGHEAIFPLLTSQLQNALGYLPQLSASLAHPHVSFILWFQVRDRATLCLQQLTGHAGGPAAVSAQPDVSLSALEKQLSDYLAAPSTATPFDLASVPRRATETRRPGVGQGVVRGACSSKAQGR